MAWHAQHFNKIAKMIREKREKYPPFLWNDKAKTELLNELTLEWVEYFEKEIENFDREQFISACGFTGK